MIDYQTAKYMADHCEDHDVAYCETCRDPISAEDLRLSGGWCLVCGEDLVLSIALHIEECETDTGGEA